MSIDEALEFCTNIQKYFIATTMPPSTHALVFMLVGVHVRWKQVVAYEFTGTSIPKICLKLVVDQIILKAENIDFKVHFVTSNCGRPINPCGRTMESAQRKQAALIIATNAILRMQSIFFFSQMAIQFCVFRGLFKIVWRIRFR